MGKKYPVGPSSHGRLENDGLAGENYFRDLQIAAQELAPGATGAGLMNGMGTTVADGSYFTDYVHYIAISKLHLAPDSHS